MKKTVSYKNTPISYSIEGKGTAVVLLHGFLEDATMWVPVKEVLVLKNKVVCIDLLGHGASGCLGYVHAMEEMAEVVKAVLKKERLRSVKIVGHSMGGYVALAFAEKYTKSVKGLCLMNSTAQEDAQERKELRLRAIEMAQNNYKALVSMSVINLFSKEVSSKLLKEIAGTKEIALKTSVQGYIAGAEGMRMRENKEAVLAGAAFKKLFIIGKNDTILNSQSLLEEAKRTATPFVILPNGHMSHIEDKNELITILANF